MKPILLPIIALFLFIETAGLALTPAHPLQKVFVKVEGVQKRASIKKIRLALFSIPGVTKVEFKIEKKWVFFNDYERMHVVVEFEHGTLTSETIIHAIEGISDQKSIYKVKFIE